MTELRVSPSLAHSRFDTLVTWLAAEWYVATRCGILDACTDDEMRRGVWLVREVPLPPHVGRKTVRPNSPEAGALARPQTLPGGVVVAQRTLAPLTQVRILAGQPPHKPHNKGAPGILQERIEFFAQALLPTSALIMFPASRFWMLPTTPPRKLVQPSPAVPAKHVSMCRG